MTHISCFLNKNELSSAVISELRSYGIKYKEKKIQKETRVELPKKKIFRQNLHCLDLTEVILFNGNAVQIPKFVADACNRILEHVEIEGIFRKAGSSIRQKEIRLNLEAGLPVSKSHHVIDVANVVKFFFRELPEPLIPPTIQETFLRSLLLGENSLRAVLLSCLLLPSLTLNTLSFFMQFLNTVSSNSLLNKMTVQNLAIIMTPGLMPFVDINTPRFNNHVKIIEMLIENANLIGTVPESIVEKIHPQINNSLNINHCIDSVQKKKKRRSGSLNHMFSGFRKMVGAAIGSSEQLDRTPEKKIMRSNLSIDCQVDLNVNHEVMHQFYKATPCMKTSKKRKCVDPVSAYSAKKKKDFLALLPINSGGFLPNTPMVKDSKKNRISLGNRHMKQQQKNFNTAALSMERRWSIVGTGWSKSKNKNTSYEKKISVKDDGFTNNVRNDIKNLNCLQFENLPPTLYSEQNCNTRKGEKTKQVIEFEAIKERVDAIEYRISEEFSRLRKSLNNRNVSVEESTSVADQVQTQYDKVVERTECLSSPRTDQLAKRLSRELKIRQSIDKNIVRSPSARKISALRRRSIEKIKLSRNKSWHISSNCKQNIPIPSISQEAFDEILKNDNIFYCSNKSETIVLKNPIENKKPLDPTLEDEKWTCGECFFNHIPIKNTIIPKIENTASEILNNDIFKTPVKNLRVENSIDSNSMNKKCTPMLPPKTVPRRAIFRTPNSSVNVQFSDAKSLDKNKFFISTPIDEESNGRASIARLRSQNAGMVMAKAKLFDDMGVNELSVSQNQNRYRKHDKKINNNINSKNVINAIRNSPVKSQVMNRQNVNENKNKSMPKNQRKGTPKNTGPDIRRQGLSHCANAIGCIVTDEGVTQCSTTQNVPSLQIRNSKETKKSIPRTVRLRYYCNKGSPRMHVQRKILVSNTSKLAKT